MNIKKGITTRFTIQKFAVVIVILIVALVIIVLMSSKINNKEDKSTLVSDIKELIPLIGNYVTAKKYQTPVTFLFTKDGVNPTLEVKGYKPISGSITVLKDDGYIINQVSDGKGCISKSGNIDDLKLEKLEECEDLSSLIPNINDSGSENGGSSNNGGGSETGKDAPITPSIND